ncbi:PC-esterase domain-containing protein 1A isoform X4 [Salmo salar]|uniref:PC-esterase domain-containing protein 1A isoform X4 n=1 Tax=Salmo salar TaxID=8030 RepID=A0ABM3F3A2_SALSA|nr:PC-esterase domain-containing protein 1A isoform X4 [Salmo salar]
MSMNTPLTIIATLSSETLLSNQCSHNFKSTSDRHSYKYWEPNLYFNEQRGNMKAVSQQQARQLLHNKFVVVLGDSIQRSVYKDIVLLLQKDKYLSLAQLKTKLCFQCVLKKTKYRSMIDLIIPGLKWLLASSPSQSTPSPPPHQGEMSFEQDILVEGGRLGQMTNGTEYREVRQFRSDHHLVRFYFLTRIYSRYMQSILRDFEDGLKPDVVIVNSCLWDVSRYNPKWHVEYQENLHKLFDKMNSILPPECLVMWNMTMPLGKRIVGGFFVPEIEHRGPTLCYDVIQANFYSSKMAVAYGLDVLDLHFQFRFSLEHRMKDGVHWNSVAHRRITTLLLQHAAEAWGVVLHCPATTVGHIDHSEQQQQLKAYTKTMTKNTDTWHYPPEPHFRRPDPRMMNPVAWATEGFGHYDGYEPQANYFTPNSAALGWHPAEDSGLEPYRPASDEPYRPASDEPYRPLEGKYSSCGEQFYGDDLPVHPKFGAGYFSFKENQANRPSLVNRQPTAPVHHRHTQVVYRHPPVNRHSLDNGCRENNGMVRNTTGHYRPVQHNKAYHPRPSVPLRPENQYVMRKKQPKKHYAPYTCQRY